MEHIFLASRDHLAIAHATGPSGAAATVVLDEGQDRNSMMRLMRDWHRRLGLAHGGLTWAPSAQQPMIVEESPDNRVPVGKPLRLLREWAVRQRVRLAI